MSSLNLPTRLTTWAGPIHTNFRRLQPLFTLAYDYRIYTTGMEFIIGLSGEKVDDTRALDRDEILAIQKAASSNAAKTVASQRMNAMAFLNELSRAVRGSGVSAVEFQPVPRDPSIRDRRLWQGLETWRVVLIPSGQSNLFMAYDLRGDAVIGSNAGSQEGLDINLAGLNGFEHGVSRRHLLIRPTVSKLFVMDLQSTNGSAINGLPATVGRAYTLADGDLLSLGRLHLQLKIVRSPGGQATII